VSPRRVVRTWLRQLCVAVRTGNLPVTGKITYELEIARSVPGRDSRAVRADVEQRHAMFGRWVIRQSERVVRRDQRLESTHCLGTRRLVILTTEYPQLRHGCGGQRRHRIVVERSVPGPTQLRGTELAKLWL